MSISEEIVALPQKEGDDIPCSVWKADGPPRGIVLMGHGLGVDRYHESVQYPMQILAEEYGCVVIAPDIPLHGVRSQLDSDDPMEIVNQWQTYWAGGGAAGIAAEFTALTRFATDSFGPLPTTYFGISLGTQYGLAFLSAHPEIRGAVLGLFGSQPPPKTPLMNRFAPEVRCPVYFIQKLEDEIHPAETSSHLFSILGADEKILDSTPGAHVEVSAKSFRNACDFLARQAGAG